MQKRLQTVAVTGTDGYVIFALPPVGVGRAVGYIYGKRWGAFAFLVVALFMLIGGYIAGQHPAGYPL